MPRIACVGDNTVDTYLDQCRQFPGGNAVNVAALAARLGARSSYLGCVGRDARGRLLLEALAQEGVDVSRCRTLAGPTAWACVTHRAGDRVFLGSSAGVSPMLTLEAADLEYLAGFDLVHSSIYSGLETAMERLRAVQANLSFDFSDDWQAPALERVAPHLRVAFLSAAGLDEPDCLALMRRVRGLGSEVVVLTRGVRGALALDAAGLASQPGAPTRVVDTLGAGDGFIAAFLLAWHGQGDLQQALRAGAEHAATVCTYAGGFGHGAPVPADSLSAIQHALHLTRG